MPQLYRFILLTLSGACLCTIARAQMGEGIALRGEIETDSTTQATEKGVEKYFAEVSDCGDSGEVGRVTQVFDNKFEFHGLKSGCKVVRVLSSDERRVLHEERVLPQSDNVPLLIRLRSARTGDKLLPAGSSFTVSVDGLRNPMPPKAARELEETQRLREAGQWDEAAARLKKLLARYPDVWQAHLNLGVAEMKMGRPVEALASFTKARELEPRSSKAALDSAIALITLHRVAEAEEAAREALKLDWSNQNAKTFLDRLQMAKERVALKDAPED